MRDGRAVDRAIRPGEHYSCRPVQGRASRSDTSLRPWRTAQRRPESRRDRGHGHVGAADAAGRPRTSRWSSTPWRRSRDDGQAAVLKGRSNYACLHRVREGVGDDPQPGLIAAGELATALRAVDSASPDSVLGAEVLRCVSGPRRWPRAVGSQTVTTLPRTRLQAGPRSRAGPGVPRREQLSVRGGMLRRAVAGQSARVRSRSSRTTRCSRSTPCTAARPCLSTTCSSSTRRTNWSPE